MSFNHKVIKSLTRLLVGVLVLMNIRAVFQPRNVV